MSVATAAGRWSALAARLAGARSSSSAPRLAGGLALARDKPGLHEAIVDVPPPPLLVLPLVGYRGRTLVPQVTVGQRVACGEPLAIGLPASAAGTVVAIEPHPIAHPSGATAPCVLVETDAATVGTHTPPEARADRVRGLADPDAPYPTLPALDALTLERLAAAGVGGLGGAAFPTPDKLADAIGGVHTLVVNGAECEPGIACDEALMTVAADEIVAGTLALARLAGARRCLVVVESDKRAARAALGAAIDAARIDAERLRLLEIAPVYPSGAERLLLRLATGIDVPPGERPARHGLLCVNVATARAAHRARLGEPSLTRVVTVAGARATRPCNARVAFGTPLADVLDATGQEARANDTRCRVGGPLSGFDVRTERVPVTAAINRIALEPPRATSPPAPCIRCAACSDVCPVGLLPQELLRHARAGADAALDRGGLDACLECGCCDLVCPSSIALTATFRHARGVRLDARRRERDAARAEALHRRRAARLSTRPAVPLEAHATLAATATRGVSDGAPDRPDVAAASAPVDAASSGTAAGAAAADPVAAALARAERRRRRKDAARAQSRDDDGDTARTGGDGLDGTSPSTGPTDER